MTRLFNLLGKNPFFKPHILGNVYETCLLTYPLDGQPPDLFYL